MSVRANEGFDLLTFYLVVSLLLMALIVVLLIRMNQALRKMDKMESELEETHRKTDQVRHNLVYSTEELKHKLDTNEIAKELVDKKVEEKTREILAAVNKEGEGR